MENIDYNRMTLEQKERLEFLYRHVEKREELTEKWRSHLFSAEITLVSIALPLSLVRDIQGISGWMLKAALLFSLLSILAGAVWQHIPVRVAEQNARQVRDDILHDRDETIPVASVSRLEKLCGPLMVWFAALSLALLFLCVVIS